MSSVKKEFSADTAVDGNIVAAPYGAKNVINTGEGYRLAWWKVDLQRQVQDATVRIYFRTDYTSRRNGVKLYTSTSSFPHLNPTSQDQLCHTVTGDPSGSDIPDVYSVTCPGRWRYLLLYTDTDNDGQGPVLDFGEVEVLILSPCTDNNYYSLNCDKLCSDRKCKAPSTSSCERNGRCTDGCDAGWRLADCTQECDSGSYGYGCSLYCTDRKCSVSSSECDHVTGQCGGGCLAGYQGTDCRQECESGSYGPSCALLCYNRLCLDGSSPCDHVTGQCAGGCQAGYRGTDCRQRTSKNTLVGAVIGSILGTLLIVVLLVVAAHVFLIRQWRLRWVKDSGDKKPVQVSRDNTQMSNIARQPADVTDHANSSSHVCNNDYAVLDPEKMPGNKDYDVIQHKEYHNI